MRIELGLGIEDVAPEVQQLFAFLGRINALRDGHLVITACFELEVTHVALCVLNGLQKT